MLQSNQYWNAKIIVENVSVVFYLNTTAVISKVISPSLRKLVAKVGKLFKKYHPSLIFLITIDALKPKTPDNAHIIGNKSKSGYK